MCAAVVFAPVRPAVASVPVVRPDSSYAAHRTVLRDRGPTQVEQVMDVMRKAWDRGVRDLTGNELLDLLEVAYPATHWHQGKVSARVADMLKQDQLRRLERDRVCSSPRSSSRMAHPVALVERQACIGGA